MLYFPQTHLALYLPVQLLQGLHLAAFVRFQVMDTLSRHSGRRHRSDIRRLRLNRRLTQITVVVHAVLAHRRVDNQIEISVGDHIVYVGSALVDFFHLRPYPSC